MAKVTLELLQNEVRGEIKIAYMRRASPVISRESINSAAPGPVAVCPTANCDLEYLRESKQSTPPPYPSAGTTERTCQITLIIWPKVVRVRTGVCMRVWIICD